MGERARQCCHGPAASARASTTGIVASSSSARHTILDMTHVSWVGSPLANLVVGGSTDYHAADYRGTVLL